MTQTFFVLPAIGVLNAGKEQKRKRVRIPTMGRNGSMKYSTDDVCACIWLHEEEGWTHRAIADLIHCHNDLVAAWCRGSQRPHAAPRKPGADFWARYQIPERAA